MKLEIKVVPGSSNDCVAGWLGDRLKLRVSAPPEKGKANKAVIKLLANALGLPAKRITIASGSSSSQKVVEIEGIEREVIYDKFPITSD